MRCICKGRSGEKEGVKGWKRRKRVRKKCGGRKKVKLIITRRKH